MENGVVIDKVAVGRVIKTLMSEQDITEKEVVASISGIHSIYRTVSLPRLPRKMLDEAAKREMERITPIPLSDLYTAWQAISMSDMETVICLVGMPRHTVDALLDTLDQVQLKPRAIDIRPLALARAADEKDAILISVESASFDVVVMISGIPELLRSLTFAARDMSPAEKVAVIKEELDRTVAFYNSGHKVNPISPNMPVFVSGELREALVATLDYTIKPLPRLLSSPQGLNIGEYAVNIGLILKQLKVNASKSRVDINIMPEAYRPRPLPFGQIISWALIVIAIAVVIPLGRSTLQVVQETAALQAKVDATQLRVDVRQGTQDTLEKMKTKVDDAEAARDAFKQPLNSFGRQRAEVNGELSEVTRLLPGAIVPQSIAYGNSVTLTGTAPDDAVILGYQRSLRDTGRFSEVLVSNMQEVKHNQWQFTLTVK